MSARVLVVDDIEANRKLLHAKLSNEYFHVITAVDGQPVHTPAEMVYRMSVTGLGQEARVTRKEDLGALEDPAGPRHTKGDQVDTAPTTGSNCCPNGTKRAPRAAPEFPRLLQERS